MNYSAQDLSIFELPPGFRGRSALFVLFWWAVQSTIFRWSPQPMYGFRRALLRAFGAKIGKKVLIRPTATVTFPWKVIIGDFSWIGDDVTLYSLGEIEIGAHTVVSQRSYVCAADHDYKELSFPIRAKRVTIGSEVWIATDVFIAPGISIQDGVVIGARSSVFKDCERHMLYVGSPAKSVHVR